MKKIYIAIITILCMLFILFLWYFLWKKYSVQDSQTNLRENIIRTWTGISNTWTGIVFWSWVKLYDYEMLENYNLPEWDLMIFNELLKNNKSYFEQIKDILFFNIWRWYVFWDNINNSDYKKFFNCLDSSGDYKNLENDIERNICEWKNMYDTKLDSNYFHEKDILMKFKQIYNWNNIDCGYFIENNYNYPEKERVYVSLTDYLVCKKLSDSKIDIKKEYYYYNMAYTLNICDELADKNLLKLCTDNVQIDPPKIIEWN